MRARQTTMLHGDAKTAGEKTPGGPRLRRIRGRESSQDHPKAQDRAAVNADKHTF